MPKISIKANRSLSCLPTVARHVIAAHEVLPRAALVPRSSCSCKSTTRAVRAPPIASRHGQASCDPHIRVLDAFAHVGAGALDPGGAREGSAAVLVLRDARKQINHRYAGGALFAWLFEGSAGFEIDGQFKFRGLLDGSVAGLFAFRILSA
jgi:hypothetical protein